MWVCLGNIVKDQVVLSSMQFCFLLLPCMCSQSHSQPGIQRLSGSMCSPGLCIQLSNRCMQWAYHSLLWLTYSWHFLLNFCPASWIIAYSTKATTSVVHWLIYFLFFLHWDYSCYCQCQWARGFQCSIPNQIVLSGGKFAWFSITCPNLAELLGWPSFGKK